MAIASRLLMRVNKILITAATDRGCRTPFEAGKPSVVFIVVVASF